jgi:spermidine synthase
MQDFAISSDRVQTMDDPLPPAFAAGPYLAQQGDYLSLHLAGDALLSVHTLMDRTRPDRLVLSYTEMMMGFVRFCPSPRTIAMLGLGGGSLAKHCYRHFPSSTILVAEINPEVIALRGRFSIPDDSPRFQVQQMDGAQMVRQANKAYDVLLIDAFDERGYPPHFQSRGFYRDCLRSLTAGGVLVINFSGDAWKTWFRQLDRVFKRRTVLYQCPDGDNVIVFATRGPLPEWTGRP